MKNFDEDKLNELGKFITDFQLKFARSPSYREIMKAQNFSSLSVVARYVGLLSSQGVIKKDRLGSIDSPYSSQSILAPVVGSVRCGTPIYAQENIESVYALPKDIFGSQEVFILHAQGDSMKGVGIQEGDLLVVRKCDYAQDGDIVVALIDDSATVKTFYKKKDAVVLHPENEKYSDIITKDVKILGVVKQLIHNL